MVKLHQAQWILNQLSKNSLAPEGGHGRRQQYNGLLADF
jgi:hypothetical protein